MRILTVCQGGAVRSVSMKHILYYGGMRHDVVAVGVESNTPETIAMLAGWADAVICMQPVMALHPALKGHKMLMVCDVGEDTFGRAFHPELQKRILEWLGRPENFALLST